jgi:hypothetical protein
MVRLFCEIAAVDLAMFACLKSWIIGRRSQLLKQRLYEVALSTNLVLEVFSTLHRDVQCRATTRLKSAFGAALFLVPKPAHHSTLPLAASIFFEYHNYLVVAMFESLAPRNLI